MDAARRLDCIVLDVGNSAATVAHFEAGSPRFVESVVHAGTAIESFEERLRAVVSAVASTLPVGIAHVNAAVKDRVVAALGPQRRVLVAPLDFAPVVTNDCEHPETVGLDRLFNASALDRRGRFIVVDAGTAITVDLVDRGVFRGGAIAPGIRLSYAALNRHTGQLPLVEPSDSPVIALGRHTRAALRAGVELGLAGLVERLISELTESFAPEQRAEIRVIVTGGDGRLLASRMRIATEADPWLTLRGIASALAGALQS